MMVLRRLLALVAVALTLVVAVPGGAVSAEPKTIEVRTVPPLEGVELELDGVTALTGPDGTTTFETEEFRDAGERLVVVDDRVELPTGDGYYENSRIFGKSRNLVVAFDLYREVSFRFVTLQGRELTVEDIDSLQLKNTLGGRFEDVDRTAPVMLHANRVVSSPTGPIVRDIVWSIDSVMVGTSNVVNRSEIRFTPTTETEILVTTLFFDAKFTVQDLFFGFPTGEAVLVEDPNGIVTSYPLEDGKLALDDLPRGDYRVTVIGPGLKLSRPVALSRNQDVDLALLSYLDLAVAATGLVVFATGTFILGWRRRKRRRSGGRRKHRRWRWASAAEPVEAEPGGSPIGPGTVTATARRLSPWRRSTDAVEVFDLADLESSAGIGVAGNGNGSAPEAPSGTETAGTAGRPAAGPPSDRPARARSAAGLRSGRRTWAESARDGVERLWPGAADPDREPWTGWERVGRWLSIALRLRPRQDADREARRESERRRSPGPVRTAAPRVGLTRSGGPLETAGASSGVTALIRRSRAVVRGQRQRAGAALARRGERLRERDGMAAEALRYLDELRDAADTVGGGSPNGAAGGRSAEGADGATRGGRQLETVGAAADRDRGGGGP